MKTSLATKQFKYKRRNELLDNIFVGFLFLPTVKGVDFKLNNLMYLPFESGRLIDGPVNWGAG